MSAARLNFSAPITNAAYSHQLLHQLAQQAATERQFKVSKCFQPSNDEGAIPLAGNWRSAWHRVESDRQAQFQAREQYFSRQAVRKRHDDTENARSEDGGLFSPMPAIGKQENEFSAALLASLEPNHIGGCCAAPVETGAKDADIKPHDHDHSSSLVPVDLDEAAHGTYAATKYIVDGASGGPAQIGQQLKQDALLAAVKPKDSLIKDIVPDGVADFSAGVAASVGVLPLAALAIHAGIHEIKDANYQLKSLDRRGKALDDDVAILENLKNVVPDIEEEIARADATRQNIDFAKRLAHTDRGIGVSSVLSGSAIAVKSTMDIGLKTTLVGLQKKFSLLDIAQQGTQIGTAGLVTGAAGTLVLGPLAGIFATTLGVFFVKKSTTKHRQLKTEFALAKQQIAANMALNKTAGMTQAHHATYNEFILRQGEKRISFFKKFGNWNKAFLSGSGLYAASATTKMVVASLALAGVGVAAANPVGLGIILGVGIVGALIMGGASLSFFYGHEKQGRYSKHTSKDHPDVDRELLSSLEFFRVLSPNGKPDPAAALTWSALGLNTRASCLQRLDVRKQSLTTFVAQAAEANGKTPPRDPKNHIWNKWFTGIRTSASYATTLAATLSPAQARLAARDKRMQARRDLGSRQLENWIGSAEGSEALLRFAKNDLDAKTAYLQEKIAVRLDLANQKLPLIPEEPSEDAQAVLEAYTSYLAKQDALIEKDQAELERSQAMLAQIERVQLAEKLSPESSEANGMDQAERANLLGNLVEYFGLPASTPENTSSERTLSKLLTKEIYKDTKEARGVLFETQLQASKLRESSTPQEPVMEKPSKSKKLLAKIISWGKKSRTP
ncbi:MAG: hypothetical protein V4695_00895 [Pseudomonadota bacterium]